jgi:hypothetical protein
MRKYDDDFGRDWAAKINKRRYRGQLRRRRQWSGCRQDCERSAVNRAAQERSRL